MAEHVNTERRRQAFYGWMLLSPAAILLSLFAFYPSRAIVLGMGLWANAKIPARGFVLTACFTPTVLPMIAAAKLWLFFLHAGFYMPGLGVLDQIGSLSGLPALNWLGHPGTALWAVIIVTIWAS